MSIVATNPLYMGLLQPLTMVAGSQATSVGVGGTGANLSSTGGSHQVVFQTSTGGAFTVAALVAGDIPNLPASIITSGTLALARGGTNADLSATGGAHQVLMQTSSGAAITVAQLAFTDISGTATTVQIGTGTPAAGKYVDGASGVWTALPTGSSFTLTNGEASAAIVIGAPVYSSSAGNCKRGQANAYSTSVLLGLASTTSVAAGGTVTIQSSGPLVLTTTQADAIVTGQSGGFTIGAYALDPAAAGKLIALGTWAGYSAGNQFTYVGVAVSTTTLIIEIEAPIGC